MILLQWIADNGWTAFWIAVIGGGIIVEIVKAWRRK